MSIIATHAQRRRDGLKARRRLWLNIHLWLGLSLGLVLAIVGLSGSILVFWQELDEWLNPRLCVVSPPPTGQARPFAELLQAADAALPADADLRFVRFPRNEHVAYLFDYQLAAADGHTPAIWQVGVDPYTALTTGKRLVRDSDTALPAHLIAIIFRLHDSLLLGDNGGIAVGIVATLLLISVLTGLILWWPLTGRWARVFSIKRGASPERLNHDLHQVSGFYTFPVLLVLLVSGIYMNLPEHLVGLVQWVSPGTRYQAPTAPAATSLPPLSPAQALALAEQRYPGGGPAWLRPPRDDDGLYIVTRIDVPGQGPFWPQRKIFLASRGGGVLDVRDPSTRTTAGDAFLEWQWPLHSGRVFGWPGRLLVFATGLAAPLLFVTGLIRWLQKRRARRQKSFIPSRNAYSQGT